MPTIYMYADETGNLDYDTQSGGSRFFGIGTATFVGDHRDAVWNGLTLRFEQERNGIDRRQGMHAKNDSWPTRGEVLRTMQQNTTRFDITLLEKAQAYAHVRARGETYLYKLAWFLHFKGIARRVSEPGDTLFVIAATLGTRARRTAVRSALHDVVCDQGPTDREIVLCIWDSATSWGLQVADYGLWVVQRDLEKGDLTPAMRAAVMPYVASLFRPWS